MPTDQTIDFVVMFLMLGLLVLGLGSVALGWIVRVWDRLMSRYFVAVPPTRIIEWEHRSDAGNRDTEPLGSWIGTAFLLPWEQGEPPTDDEMLAWLALRLADDGTPYYAESRIAKFIGGRVEDRIAQVRAVRGVSSPPKSVATKNYPHRTPEQEALRQQLRLGK